MTIIVTSLCNLWFLLILIHIQVVCITCKNLCLLHINLEKALKAWDEPLSKDCCASAKLRSWESWPIQLCVFKELIFRKANLHKTPRKIAFSISFPHLLQEHQHSPLLQITTLVALLFQCSINPLGYRLSSKKWPGSFYFFIYFF